MGTWFSGGSADRPSPQGSSPMFFSSSFLSSKYILAWLLHEMVPEHEQVREEKCSSFSVFLHASSDSGDPQLQGRVEWWKWDLKKDGRQEVGRGDYGYRLREQGQESGCYLRKLKNFLQNSMANVKNLFSSTLGCKWDWMGEDKDDSLLV